MTDSETIAELPKSEQTVASMAGPFDALRAKIEASLEGQALEPEPACEPWVAHAAFERQRDAEGNTRYSDPTDCDGMLRILDQTGSVWLVQCDGCGFEVGVQMHKVDPKLVVERKLAKAGVPEMFASKRFDDDEPVQAPTLDAARRWVKQFNAHRLGDSLPALAVYGKPGRGKSHLLSLIVEALIRRTGVDALYLSAAQLFDQLQAGMDEGSYEIRWQRVLRVPVLALDDLGSGRASEWKQDRLAALVDYRYSKELPLVVATNLSPGPAWEKVFGPRTASRMSGMMLRLELAGVDRRAHAQQRLTDG